MIDDKLKEVLEEFAVSWHGSSEGFGNRTTEEVYKDSIFAIKKIVRESLPKEKKVKIITDEIVRGREWNACLDEIKEEWK